MTKILLSTLVLAGICLSSQAQDIHFSQYFASPLTLNPAQTGLINKDYRVAVNYRSQNYTVSSNPYQTASLSYDMPILRGKLPEGDAVGIGLIAFYDKAGTGGLQNLSGGVSFAYHKSLGKEKQHTVSLGVQALFVSKSINFDKLRFEDQLNPRQPEAYLPTNENLANQDVSYPDFNVGALYTGRPTDKSTAYAGVSYFHLSQPEEKFLGGGTTKDIKIAPRYSAYIGGSGEVNELVTVFGSGLYQSQGPAQEILVGGAVGFILNPQHSEDRRNTTFYLGSWYRFNDAIVPYVGFEWDKMQIGFTYDVTVSKAQNLTQSQGAYEISLIYNGAINKIVRPKYNFACPKF